MDFLQKVAYHHALVKNIGEEHNDFQVIFTAAVGSQNYGLDSPTSDCDTFTIILPRYIDFISNANLISFEKEVDDGKIIVKDLRLMMNLLRKTSPNSIEVFASKYMIFEPEYEILQKTFFNPDMLYYLIHANHKHMLNAIAGMIHQLHGRNMTEGKRFSHALRLNDLYAQFLDNERTNILGFRFKGARDLAYAAKTNEHPSEEEVAYYQEQIERIAAFLKEEANRFETSTEQKSLEYIANHTINRLQFEITKIYLAQNNFIYKE